MQGGTEGQESSHIKREEAYKGNSKGNLPTRLMCKGHYIEGGKSHLASKLTIEK